ncbi:lysozyme C, milk isozyme-like [Eublepharis macularius]|uniref:Lysozyme C, milk isozyme-like n=1 Tax=Eublepharis macularius TaxID=481883 RepID=A0AA97LLA0_EUBMA|nr:lysozyme C, milk isozyme-like [Eublepharis macularius]
MKAIFCQPLLLLVYFVFAIHAKIYERCELAKQLDNHGMDGYQGYSLANWVCMAFFESGFDTEAVSQNKDGTSDFGIFQINSGWWCAVEDSVSENLCRIDCKDLLNADIENNILCAKRIVRDPQGMAAWNEWKTHCEGKNLSEWVKGC